MHMLQEQQSAFTDEEWKLMSAENGAKVFRELHPEHALIPQLLSLVAEQVRCSVWRSAHNRPFSVQTVEQKRVKIAIAGVNQAGKSFTLDTMLRVTETSTVSW